MRTSSEITIVRLGQENVSVPITPASRRKWKLMEEDSITLSFNLADSVDFNIGDYIDDEIFGRFTISEDPLPADYDPVSGAYKYTLRFDADWICWKNYIFMLTYGTDPYYRKETEWVLTDKLANHLEVFRQNLEAIGYTGYTVNVHTADIPSHAQAISITYSGTDLLTALKSLAEAYECEFWITNKVIHFGKCETGSERIPLSMTDDSGREINVENMVPSRNDSEYGNRFYAFGSTKNIPETYRKHLTFKADDISRVAGYSAFKDSNRAINPGMLKRSTVQSPTPSQMTYSGAWTEHSYTVIEEDSDEMMSWQVIKEEKTTAPIPVVQGWPFTVTPYVSPYGSFDYTVYIYDQSGDLLASQTDVLVPLTYTIPAGVESVTVHYSYVFATHQVRPAPLAPTVEWEENLEYAYFAQVSYSGGTFLVRLVEGYFIPVSDRSTTVSYGSMPSDFTLNTEYTLATTGADAINVLAVPVSYYTSDEDSVNLVRLVGERRLMLPRPPYTDTDLQAIASDIENGYVQRGDLSRDQIVEKVVYFENIYPRCALRVTAVEEGEYANDTEYSDGSVTKATLPAFTLQAKRIDGASDVDFPFDPRTMMGTGQTLTATFLTPDEANNYSHKGSQNENACSLMGMTFKVSCSRANGVTTYQLVWNSDYGEKLPNEILRPRVGDAFILAGWNPAAMSSLNIIASAEKELAIVADEYARLMEEAQFTFDCSMMSDWILARCSQDGEKYIPDGLLSPGQKVTVHHGALRADKDTRVIGFEYKLDIPYDTPVYTVGETEAYSRLKEIEKSLNATTVNTYSTSGSASSSGASSSSSSSSSSAKETLHLLPGSMTGQSAVDYDGTVEKTMKVPSMVDHLIDGGTIPRIIEKDGDMVLVDKDGTEVAGKQFFELAIASSSVNPETGETEYTYSVKLKDEYVGLWASGWIAAGGVGAASGGGSGLIETVSRWSDLQNMSTAPEDGTSAVFNSRAVYEVYQAVKALQRSTPNVSLSNGEAYSTLSVNGQSAQLYSKAQVDSLLANIDLSGYVTNEALTTAIGNINHLSSVTTNQDGTLDFNWKNGDTTRADLSHRHLDYENSINTITANYVPKNRKINGHPLDSDVDLSATEDLGVATWAMDDGSSGTTVPFDRLPNLYIGGTMVANSPDRATLLGVAAISNSLSSTGSEQSLIVWEPNAGGTGVGAWHLLGNLYADGWIASGGIGNDSGGGGIDLDRVWQSLTNNTDKPNVEINIAHIPTLTAAKIPDITTAKVSDINTWVTGKGLSIAGISVNIGGSITTAALKQALGISGDETPTISSVVLTNGANYSEITVDDTSASFYTKAQIDSALAGKQDKYPFTITGTSGATYNLGNFVTIDGAQTITGAKTFSGGITMSGANILPSADSANSLGSNDYRFNAAFIRNIYTSFFQFLDGTTKAVTGNIAFGDGYLQLSLAGTNAVNYMFYSSNGFFKQGGGVPLGRSDHRWSSVYSVDADLSGDLALAQTSHIDIGPLRIEYDATNKALHITKKDSNDTETYGLYADGFVAAGGVQQTS